MKLCQASGIIPIICFSKNSQHFGLSTSLG